MTTSRLAFSYNREVYALPGRADDIRSQGCNRLIREKIAEPLTSVEELLDSLGMKASVRKDRTSLADILQETYSGSISQEKIGSMQKILAATMTERGITIEEIAASTGLPYHTPNNLCSILESDGIISIDLLQRCSIRTKNF